mmetsp:Transcript_7352/g.9630  ORF Transcript_7352/g.9630 Transcript_7352/m.9630 type:complete len:80 (+) Transcript_7352:1847-2086(+)
MHKNGPIRRELRKSNLFNLFSRCTDDKLAATETSSSYGKEFYSFQAAAGGLSEQRLCLFIFLGIRIPAGDRKLNANGTT